VNKTILKPRLLQQWAAPVRIRAIFPT